MIAPTLRTMKISRALKRVRGLATEPVSPPPCINHRPILGSHKLMHCPLDTVRLAGLEQEASLLSLTFPCGTEEQGNKSLSLPLFPLSSFSFFISSLSETGGGSSRLDQHVIYLQTDLIIGPGTFLPSISSLVSFSECPSLSLKEQARIPYLFPQEPQPSHTRWQRTSEW